MEWLFKNPLAHMEGPTFLAWFWACVVAAVGTICFVRHRIQRVEDRDPLPIPGQINPFQVAFLRAGENEVIRAAVLELVELGRLVEVEVPVQKGRAQTTQRQWQMANPRDTGADLPLLQRSILKAFLSPGDPDLVFGPEIRSFVREQTRPFEAWMEQEQLGVGPRALFRLKALGWILLVCIEALGIYKYCAAIAHGRTNVAFLIISMVLTAIVILVASFPARLSSRGREFLRDLQSAHDGLRRVQDAPGNVPSTQPAFGGASLALMAMGLFGVSALQGSAYDPVFQSYQRSAGNSGGCGGGSGCGGSGGGGDGGGGGCGGCGGD